jgi:hypothetical protein
MSSRARGHPSTATMLPPQGTRWGVSGTAATPSSRSATTPVMLPVDEVRIDPVKINNIGLGKSIYTKEQLEEFACFQDNQGTRKAYLAETAEMA